VVCVPNAIGEVTLTIGPEEVVPTPIKVIVIGPLLAVLLMTRLAVGDPTLVGVKLSVIPQDEDGERLVPQVWDTMLKFDAFGPVIAGAANTIESVPVLLTNTVCVGLLLPRGVEPKSR